MKKLLKTINKRFQGVGLGIPRSVDKPKVHVNFLIGDKPHKKKGGVYQREFGFGFIKVEGKEIY